MVISLYYNFSILVLFQKQLKNHGNYNPKVITAFNISILQTIILFFLLFLLNYLTGFSTNYLKLMIYGLALILYIYNYFTYIRGNKLDEINKQFEKSNLNNTKNRRLTLFFILLIFSTCNFMIILLSYLKSINNN